MSRANPLLRPDKHACCPNASHLRIVSRYGDWAWSLVLAGASLPVLCCPWCGLQLPTRASSLRLSVVR